MKIVIACLIAIIVLLQLRLWTGAGSFAQVSELSGRIDEQKQDNISLEARNTLLYREVNELKTGLDAIEEHARSELGMIREGETFYMIVEEGDQAPAPESSSRIQPANP